MNICFFLLVDVVQISLVFMLFWLGQSSGSVCNIILYFPDRFKYVGYHLNTVCLNKADVLNKLLCMILKCFWRVKIVLEAKQRGVGYFTHLVQSTAKTWRNLVVDVHRIHKLSYCIHFFLHEHGLIFFVIPSCGEYWKDIQNVCGSIGTIGNRDPKP